MFGLSWRERIEKIILHASVESIDIYKEKCKEYLNTFNDKCMPSQEDADAIKRVYFDAVTNAIAEIMRNASTRIFFQFQRTLMTPSITGYEIKDNQIEHGFSAGMLFAMCYWACTGKKAKPKSCSKLNHIQNFIMTSALHEMDDESILQEE